MDQKQRMQLGFVLACGAVGVAILVWLLSSGVSSRGRQAMVDAPAVATVRVASRPATTRAAATRPLWRQFMNAMRKPDRSAALKMLADDPKLATVEQAELGYCTPLHYAAAHGDIELATLLLDAGANLNAVEDRHQGTPLEWATFEGQVEMVKFLLMQGAVVDAVARDVAAMGARGENVWTKVPLAKRKATYQEIVKLLEDATMGKRPTTFATTRAG